MKCLRCGQRIIIGSKRGLCSVCAVPLDGDDLDERHELGPDDKDVLCDPREIPTICPCCGGPKLAADSTCRQCELECEHRGREFPWERNG